MPLAALGAQALGGGLADSGSAISGNSPVNVGGINSEPFDWQAWVNANGEIGTLDVLAQQGIEVTGSNAAIILVLLAIAAVTGGVMLARR